MTTPPQGPQSSTPGGQPPPPPGYGPPTGGTGQPPAPPGYGNQAQGQPGQPGQQQWGSAPAKTFKKSNKKTWVAVGIAGALGLALCGGGGLFAFSKLSGGGPQPETALPANSIGFAKVDLDPAADQKVDAIRFMNKFPALKEEMGDVDEDEDLRKAVFDSIKDEGGLEGVDYAEDVEPWLGQRFGVSMLPSSDGAEPEVVVALASTDEEAAAQGLDKITEDGGYCSVQEDFAICGEEQSIVDKAVNDAKESPLSEAEDFSQDMEGLGEDGVMAAWFDAGKAKELDPSLSSADTQGRVAAAVRFDGPTLEVAGRMTGLPKESVPSGDGTSIEALPADTLGALSIAGLDDTITKAWPEVEKNLAGVAGPTWQQDLQSFETQTGLSIPEDLAKALGSDTVLAVGPDAQNPKVALRTNGDRAVIDEMVALIQGPSAGSGYSTTPGTTAGPQVSVTDGKDDRVVVASDEAYGSEVGDGSGLGDEDKFKDAVPNAGEAAMAGYLDVATLVDTFGSDMTQEERENWGALSAAGFSATADGEDAMEFSVRVTTK